MLVFGPVVVLRVEGETMAPALLREGTKIATTAVTGSPATAMAQCTATTQGMELLGYAHALNFLPLFLSPEPKNPSNQCRSMGLSIVFSGNTCTSTCALRECTAELLSASLPAFVFYCPWKWKH